MASEAYKKFMREIGYHGVTLTTAMIRGDHAHMISSLREMVKIAKSAIQELSGEERCRFLEEFIRLLPF